MTDSNEKANRLLRKRAARKQDRRKSINQAMRLLEAGRKKYDDSVYQLIRAVTENQDDIDRAHRELAAKIEADRKLQAARDKKLEKMVKAAMDKRR